MSGSSDNPHLLCRTRALPHPPFSWLIIRVAGQVKLDKKRVHLFSGVPDWASPSSHDSTSLQPYTQGQLDIAGMLSWLSRPPPPPPVSCQEGFLNYFQVRTLCSEMEQRRAETGQCLCRVPRPVPWSQSGLLPLTPELAWRRNPPCSTAETAAVKHPYPSSGTARAIGNEGSRNSDSQAALIGRTGPSATQPGHLRSFACKGSSSLPRSGSGRRNHA